GAGPTDHRGGRRGPGGRNLRGSSRGRVAARGHHRHHRKGPALHPVARGAELPHGERAVVAAARGGPGPRPHLNVSEGRDGPRAESVAFAITGSPSPRTGSASWRLRSRGIALRRVRCTGAM